jgi:hypothetical protein
MMNFLEVIQGAGEHKQGGKLPLSKKKGKNDRNDASEATDHGCFDPRTIGRKDSVQIGLSCPFRNIQKENAHSGTV